MADDTRRLRVAAEEDHRAAAQARHAHDQRIIRVEHGRATLGHAPHRDRLDAREFGRGVDAAQTEVVALAHVGHHRDVTPIEAEPLTKHAATRGLQHGRVDARMRKHRARALRAAAIARVDAAAFDVDAVGAGHTHAQGRAAARGARCSE